jgi:hypothetical protein
LLKNSIRQTKAGLRAGEIANLTGDMVVGSTGEVGSVLELRDNAASSRRIPLHPDVRAALVGWHLGSCRPGDYVPVRVLNDGR